jgi:hypothetical protein
MSQKTLSVQKVDLTIVKSDPPRLVINARGVATTPGWKRPRLEPSYTKFPADGIQEFDFVADPPDRLVQQVLSPITAEPLEWENPPSHLRGVRVYAESNEITVPIKDAQSCVL